MRDVNFVDEVLKVTERFALINDELNKADSSTIDIVEYAVVLAKLE